MVLPREWRIPSERRHCHVAMEPLLRRAHCIICSAVGATSILPSLNQSHAYSHIAVAADHFRSPLHPDIVNVMMHHTTPPTTTT